ncbi:MAG: hypothetical protein NC177_14860 [Ruminococcus flavefaciens]|nr:hypothetical protein [Ruminococcus flavefaciens]
MGNFWIRIKNGSFNANLDITEALRTFPMVKLKKLFELICSESDDNANAIIAIDTYIGELIIDAQRQWYVAAKMFRDGYVAISFMYDATKAEKRTTDRNNGKLLNKVKRTKKNYDRYIKIQNVFSEIKSKYLI